MPRKILEMLKNAVIVLLLLNIVLLTLMALPGSIVSQMSLPGFVMDFLGVQQEDAPVLSSPDRHKAAAMPTLISIQQEAGRASVRRNPAAMEMAFDRFSGFLGQALLTAENPTPKQDWDMLSLQGVLFSYDGGVPAQALSQWLSEADGAVQGTFGTYVLACQEEGVSLYTVGDDEILCYTTQVSSTSLSAYLSAYTPDGTAFAFQRAGVAVDPLTLWESPVTLQNYSVSIPSGRDFANRIASALDFNPYGSGVYSGLDGSTVYNEGERSVTVYTNGSLVLSIAGEGYTRFSALSSSPADIIHAAGNLLDVVCSNTKGDAQMYLCGFSQEGGITTLTYRYILDGVPVYPACGKITFEGTALASLSLSVRSFSQRDSGVTLLPIGQAAAISEAGKRLIPAYDLSANGTVSPGWRAQ